MKIVANTPSESAAAPAHAEHAQWAKQSLIDDEAQWIRDRGLIPDMRRIELEWVEGLQKAERREELRKHRPSPSVDPRDDPAGDLAKERGYQLMRNRKIARELRKQKLIARAVLQADPEMRALFVRLQYILNRCQVGDPDFQHLGTDLGLIFTTHKRRKGRFKELNAEQREMELKKALVKVADRSTDTTALGHWHA